MRAQTHDVTTLCRRLIGGGALFLLTINASNTASAADHELMLGDWLLSCAPAAGTQSECSLKQTLRDAKSRQVVAFQLRKAGKAAFLSVPVPLGVSIPFDVNVMLSQKLEVPLRLASCGTDGCEAVIPIDTKLTGQLKTAERLAVKFQDSKSGKVVVINGSPNGLAQGLAMVAASDVHE